MDSNVVIGGSFYRAPIEVEIARSGIERIPVSRDSQIRIFRVGLSYGIIGNRVIGVICPGVGRGKGQITAAALAADEYTVRLHLCKAVEPGRGGSRQIPFIPAGRRYILRCRIRCCISRAIVIGYGLTVPVAQQLIHPIGVAAGNTFHIGMELYFFDQDIVCYVIDAVRKDRAEQAERFAGGIAALQLPVCPAVIPVWLCRRDIGVLHVVPGMAIVVFSDVSRGIENDRKSRILQPCFIQLIG